MQPVGRKKIFSFTVGIKLSADLLSVLFVGLAKRLTYMVLELCRLFLLM